LGSNDEKIHEIKIEENIQILESRNNPDHLFDEFNQIVLLFSYPSLFD